MTDLSVCIIFRAEDAHYLPQCTESIPPGVEVCTVQCIESPGRTSRFVVTEEKEIANGTIVRQALWQYPRGEFRFDLARNHSLTLARRKWILALDADERLVEHQWKDWIQATEEAPATVGGLTVGVWGSVPKMNGAIARHNGGQIRLFRNRPDIYFRKRVHEFFSLPDVIEEAGLAVIDSTLGIHHVGYETSPAELLKKCERNIALSARELAANPRQPDIQNKLYETLHLQHELRG